MLTIGRATATPVLIVAILALAGCVAPPTGPSVMALPAKDKSFEAFQADDLTCRQWASQQIGGVAPAEAANQSVIGSAAVGTVLGAAAGAAIGAATGNPAAGAAIGAGSGLALGTATGFGAAQASGGSLQRRYDIGYIQCMTAKGEDVPQSLPQTVAAYPTPYYYSYPNYYAYPSYPWYGPAFVGVGFGFHGGHHFRHR